MRSRSHEPGIAPNPPPASVAMWGVAAVAACRVLVLVLLKRGRVLWVRDVLLLRPHRLFRFEFGGPKA